MENLKHIQVLLLKWLKHFSIRNHEQIRIACKSLCIANGIEEKYAILKLFHPLLKMGFVEFVGKGQYQVSPPLIIYYPKSKLVVGINLSDNQKENIKEFDCKEDIWGVVRFFEKNNNLINLGETIKCRFQSYDNKLLSQFPKLKDVVSTFDVAPLLSTNMQYYDVFNHKWENLNKEWGICRTGSESFICYYNLDGKYLKIPSNIINPEGRLLAEGFQASSEREKIFSYNIDSKILTVNNMNLPILIERVLRLCSMNKGAVEQDLNCQINFPNITMQTVKQLNRIFNTVTEITYG